MSSDLAIKVGGLSKCYQIYEKPGDRLKQFVLPRIQRLLKIQQKQHFQEFWALKDVSFEIKKGETVGIIGRNGSGKSTLLQLICGTLNPTQGSIFTNGRVAALLELGAGFNPEFTGRENIFLSASLLGLTRLQIKERYQDIIAFADIGNFVDQPVKTYSSGMYIRLAFAIAVHVDADILIIDEALAVGDLFFQGKCLNRIEDLLQSRKLTLLFVSHDLVTVPRFCKTAIWLDHGTIQEAGPAVSVCDSYISQAQSKESFKKEDHKPISHEITWGKQDSRFGTAEFTIRQVKFIDKPELIPIFITGEQIEIEISINASDAARNFQISATIFTDSGNYVFGTATLYDNFCITKRVVRLTMPNIPLLRGHYELSIGLWNETCTVPYDLQERCYKFTISNPNSHDEGIVAIPHEWVQFD